MEHIELPNEPTEYVPHQESHGNYYWTSSTGHRCDMLNCEINKNSRSLQPIINYLCSKVKKNDSIDTPSEKMPLVPVI